MSIEDTLTQRGATHGDFGDNAEMAQTLKRVMQEAACNWDLLSPVHREALDLIATKISRILSGGQNNVDNWHDIAGYATLVEKRIPRS